MRANVQLKPSLRKTMFEGRFNQANAKTKGLTLPNYPTVVWRNLLLILFALPMAAQAQVSGNVFIDNNGNGTRENNATYRERGLGGVTVTAYKSDGSIAATTVSDATCGSEGNYTLQIAPGDYPLRVEFEAPAPYKETFSQNTSVQFLNGPASNINYGVSEPGNYADVTKGFNVISSVAVKNGFGGAPTPIVKSFGYQQGANGGTPATTVEHAIDDYGFLRGIGTDKLHKKVYYSQGTKNFVRNGSAPNNPSTKIFQSDFNNPNTTALADYLDLASIGLPVATFSNESKGYYPLSWDNGFNTNTPFDWEASWGRVGLGDLDVDKKNEKGYVISMSTQQLISFPVNKPGMDFTRFSAGDLLPTNALPNASQVARFDIPYPGDGINGGAIPTNNFDATYIPNHKDDWFVDGLGIHKGKVYVGVSNPRMYPRVGQYTGSNYTNFNGSAYIIYYSFDPQTGAWARVMDAYMGDQVSGSLHAGCCRATPFPFVASDIDFDSYNDEMILSVKNLRGDFNVNPNPAVPNPQTSAEYGGNNFFIPHMAYRAFPSTPGAATYNLEYSTGANAGTVDRCGSNYAPPVAPTATPWGNSNNYYVEYGIQEQLGSVIVPSHENYYNSYEGADGFGFIGASATFPGGNETIFYYSDPQNSQSGGINWIPNDANGSNFKQEMWSGNPQSPFFGKGQGVGDIELIYDVAPLEIGNRVWLDTDGDGVQDPNEAPISGVVINLYADVNKDGIADNATVIGTATTAADGTWYFNEANVADGDPSTAGNQIGLAAGMGYVVQIASSQFNATGSGPLANLTPTVANTGGAGQADVRDSDATLVGGLSQIAVVAGSAGENNHALDFGFAPPKASLGNYVWLDDNKDGTQDATEVGVAGITVSLYNAAGAVIGTTVTDAYGKYEFTNLDPGTYSVGFTPPVNYTFTTQDTGGNTVTSNTTDSDVNPTTGRTAAITLAAGENNPTLDAGLIYSQPITASLGDRVWLDTDKNGVQNAGEQGVSGVTVTLYNAAGTAVGTTITDGNGNYNFANLTPGDYSVGFSLPAGYVFTGQDAGGNDATDSDVNPTSGRTITTNLIAGENDPTWDAGIYAAPPTTASLGDKVWLDLDNDNIQDANEPGVAGVTVTLFDAAGAPVGTTTTDAFGNYLFAGLTPGVYSVGFTNIPAGFTLVSKDAGTNDASDSDADPTTGRTPPTTLVAGENDMTWDAGIRATAPAGTAQLGNFVWYDANKNGVQDAGEAGVGGVTATLYNAAGAAIGTTTTDGSGFYIFPNLAAGDYSVGFSNLPVGYVFTGADAGANDAADSDANPSNGRTPVTNLTAGESDMTWDAGIYPSGSPAGTASLGNKVWNDINGDGIQDAGEAGVGGVTVRLLDAAGNVVRTTTTDEFGNYIFTGLDAGSYIVEFANLPVGFTFSASGQGGNPDGDSNANPTTGRTAPITLGTGEDNMSVDAGIHQDLTKASLGNFVWLDANANGIQDAGEVGVSGVKVMLLNGAGTPVATTWTDANGFYSFTGLNPGEYSVNFSQFPTGYTATTQDAGGNDATDSDVNPATGSTIVTTLVAGENDPTWDLGLVNSKASLGDFVWFDDDQDGVQDPGERGVAGVTVILYDAAGTAVASTVTDATGKYFFANLNPGSYSVGFSTLPSGTVFSPQNAGGDAGKDSNVNPSTGRTPLVTLAAGDNNLTVDAGIMAPPKAGLGNYVWTDTNGNGIQDADERGLAGVTVQLYDATRTILLATAVTDGNGYYTFSNLEPGTYNVKFVTPTGFTLTGSNVGDDASDSDADPITGFTGPYILGAGSYNPTVDAGFKPPLTLPVDYLNIKVYAKSEQVHLDWATVTEVQNAKFEIERVRNTSETPEFVGFVKSNGNGNSTRVQNYSFVDAQPYQGKSYYRLVQVDFDGKRSLSKWYSVVNEKGKLAFEMLVYPNPATDKVSLELQGNAGNQVSVSIYNLAGQVVQAQNINLTTDGTSVYELNTQSLPQGVYMLKASSNDDTKVLKLVVKK